MSGGPFRELFVELSREAFEIAKGIGEQAVRRAEESRVLHAPAAPAKPLAFDFVGRHVAERYRWSYVETRRHRATCDVSWLVRLKCGHHHVIAFPERVLHRSPSEAFDFLLDHLDNHAHERSCYCVQHERRCASCSRRLDDDLPTQRTPVWRGSEPSILLTCTDADCVAWALQVRHAEREARLAR